jgi:DNA-binding Xre family transcriptional regulator
MQRTKLQMILRQRDLTQKDLKKMIDERFPDAPISLDALNRYITGNRPNVQLSTIRRICDVLDVTPNEIID